MQYRKHSLQIFFLIFVFIILVIAESFHDNSFIKLSNCVLIVLLFEYK